MLVAHLQTDPVYKNETGIGHVQLIFRTEK